MNLLAIKVERMDCIIIVKNVTKNVIKNGNKKQVMINHLNINIIVEDGRCKVINRDFQLSLEEYISFRQNNPLCYYCGGPLPQTGLGIDRKDNSKGYVLDNIIPSCRDCNIMRNDIWSYEDFMEFIVPGIRMFKLKNKERLEV